jgi:hypothetical protein
MHSTRIFSLLSSVLFELSHYRSTYTPSPIRAPSSRKFSPWCSVHEIEGHSLSWGGRSFSVVCLYVRERTGHKRLWPAPRCSFPISIYFVDTSLAAGSCRRSGSRRQRSPIQHQHEHLRRLCRRSRCACARLRYNSRRSSCVAASSSTTASASEACGLRRSSENSDVLFPSSMNVIGGPICERRRPLV